jgi:beta-lactamase regulating signal transducer with metallopeptidase domain
MVSVFYKFLSNSLNIAFFIILLALFEPYIKKFLSAVCLYRLWIVLLLGLFLPMRFTGMNALFYISLPRIAVDNIADNGDDDMTEYNKLSTEESQLLPSKHLTLDTDRDNTKVRLPYLLKRLLSVSIAVILHNGYWLPGMLWIVGLVVLAKKGIGYYIYLKRLKRFMSPFDQKEFRAAYQQCVRELNLKEGRGLKKIINAKLYTCSVIKSPMTIGTFRPVIVLPDETYTDREFYFVIKHELVHIRRRDSMVKLAMVIVRSFHWYNPFCYVLSRHLDEWCEASCDELVLHNKTKSDCLYYGKLLLRYAMTLEDRAFTVNMIGGKKYMKKRLSSIMEHKNKRSGKILVSMAVLVVFTIGIVAVNHGTSVLASTEQEGTANQQEESSLASVDQSSDNQDVSESTDNNSDLKGIAVKEPDQDLTQADSADSKTSAVSGDAVADYAIAANGALYSYGGNDLSTGVDCSGFVQAVYKEAGYELPRTLKEQASSFDTVSLDSLKPGDILFYGTKDDNTICHNGIYIGEDKVIHASNLRDGVKISAYDYRPIVSAARVIKD